MVNDIQNVALGQGQLIKTTKVKKPSYTKFIIKAQKLKLHAFHKWHSSGRIEDKNIYRKFSRDLKRILEDKSISHKRAHLYHLEILVVSTDKVNRKLSTHNPIHPIPIQIKRQDGTFTSNPTEIFSTIISVVYSQLMMAQTVPCLLAPAKKLEKIIFTPDHIYQTLWNLKPSFSSGPDGITNSFLRNCAPGLSIPLCHIINFSFNVHEIPLDWSSAYITPIHKKGSTSDPGNYRPIFYLFISKNLVKGHFESASNMTKTKRKTITKEKRKPRRAKKKQQK